MSDSIEPSSEGYVSVPGGRVWYQISGTGDAVPLVVLHGGLNLSREQLLDILGTLTVLQEDEDMLTQHQQDYDDASREMREHHASSTPDEEEFDQGQSCQWEADMVCPRCGTESGTAWTTLMGGHSPSRHPLKRLFFSVELAKKKHEKGS